jgi:hypothetical protein
VACSEDQVARHQHCCGFAHCRVAFLLEQKHACEAMKAIFHLPLSNLIKRFIGERRLVVVDVCFLLANKGLGYRQPAFTVAIIGVASHRRADKKYELIYSGK